MVPNRIAIIMFSNISMEANLHKEKNHALVNNNDDINSENDGIKRQL